MGYSCHLTTTSRSCGPVLTGGCDLGAISADQIGYRGQPAREGYRSASARALCCGRRLTILVHQIRGLTGDRSFDVFFLFCAQSGLDPHGASRGFHPSTEPSPQCIGLLLGITFYKCIVLVYAYIVRFICRCSASCFFARETFDRPSWPCVTRA